MAVFLFTGLVEVVIQPMLELKDSGLARRFLLESLLLQCVQPPSPKAVPDILEWALETLVEGIPLPPLGVVGDIGHLVFAEAGLSVESPPAEEHHLTGQKHPLPSPLVRQYEDLVLGKLYGDRTFDRAVDGLRRYADRRDRAKGLAFLLQQIGSRAGYQGVMLSPAVIRDLKRLDGAEVLGQASESFSKQGPLRLEELKEAFLETDLEHSPRLMEFLYQDLVSHVRNIGEVLAAEDVFELEHGTAIAGFGQRIALRQVISAATWLASEIPQQPVRPLNLKQQVATKIVDEDTYPIGGFSSISNRGSIESLLHSQLAFMEENDRPDMFDIKFLRDELLYYSRDENQFLRRRRSFVFGLFPDLTTARRMDAGLPWQRIIVLLGLFRVAVERLTDWLSEDALRFDFVVLKPSGKKTGPDPTLSNERELLEILFREPMANKSVQILECETLEEFQEHCGQLARRSLCHVVVLSTMERRIEVENAHMTRVRLDGPVPALTIDEETWSAPENDGPLAAWPEAILQLLKAWVAG